MARRLLPLLAVLAVASGCDAVAPAAAVVNGVRISEERIQDEIDAVRAVESFRELVRQQGDEVRGTYRREVLSTFIRVELESQEAAKRGIEVDEGDVDRLLKQIESQVGGPKQFEQLLEQQNLTRPRARLLARRQLIREQLMKEITKQLTVDDETIRRTYEQGSGAFTQVHLARIVVRTQEEAQQVAELAGQGDFGALARERSLDPAAAENGGDLGFVDLSDVPFAQQIEAVPAGGIAGPFPEGGAFAVYKVVERRTKPLEDVREEIADNLLARDREREFDRWAAERLREARVRVNPKYGRFDERSLTVVPGTGTIRE